MKKEDMIKIIACSIAAILVVVMVIIRGVGSNDVSKDAIASLNKDIVSIYEYANRYKIPTTGTVAISANYKGAHGESFPKDFNFNYSLEDNVLYFSNDEGYNTLELPKELVELYNIFKEKPEDILVSKEEKNSGNSVIVTLDKEILKKNLSKDIEKAELTINKESAVSSKIKDMTLTIDDYIINIDNNKYKIMYNQDSIDITIVKSGYSLAINKNIKVNVISKEGVDNYNIIVDNYVYSLNISDDTVKFTANTKASIYNSITATFTKADVTVNKDKVNDVKNNPLTRYFNEKE